MKSGVCRHARFLAALTAFLGRVGLCAGSVQADDRVEQIDVPILRDVFASRLQRIAPRRNNRGVHSGDNHLTHR